jgi:hypothetical protein
VARPHSLNRLRVGALRHAQTTCRYSDKALRTSLSYAPFAYAVERELALRHHMLSQDDPCRRGYEFVSQDLDLWGLREGRRAGLPTASHSRRSSTSMNTGDPIVTSAVIASKFKYFGARDSPSRSQS